MAGTMSDTYNFSTEAGGYEFKASLGYIEYTAANKTKLN